LNLAVQGSHDVNSCEHCLPVTFGHQHQRLNRGLRFFGIVLRLRQVVMYCAAFRNVTNGLLPGSMIGSKNRYPTTPRLPPLRAPGGTRTMSEIIR
jgi:hypothetical protein